MYYAHFGLKEPPFKITPNTEVFYTGANRGAVLDALMYAIQSGEGIIKVVGEVGSGKTMLCRMLQTQLPENIERIYLANPSVAPEDVLHAIAFELQLKLPKNADRLKVMQVLQSHLLARHAAGKQVVIFIEEAQGMPIATLEEIRLLSNLETKNDKLLQMVLFGQPELDDNLNQPNIRQLRERITHSFHLSPMPHKEIGDYLMFRLRASGYFGPPLFTDAAISKLSSAADGLVRRVNILADKALLATFAAGAYQVTPKFVEAAIQDSEFGAEKNKIAKKRTHLIIGCLALLILGLLGGYVASNWMHQSTPLSNQPLAKKSVAPHQPAKVTQTAPAAATSNTTAPNIIAQAQSTTLSAAPPATAATSLPPANASTAALPVNAEPSPAPIANAQAVAPSSPAPQQASELVVKPTDAPTSTLLARRISATSQWLSKQSPELVTIQMMGGYDDAQLNAQLDVLSQQLEVDKLYVYRTKTSQAGLANTPFTIVLYGSYPNRVQAVQALKQLPPNIQKNRPQLRTIAGVLAEMK
jgi:MSHA biogenesis protein MshM